MGQSPPNRTQKRAPESAKAVSSADWRHEPCYSTIAVLLGICYFLVSFSLLLCSSWLAFKFLLLEGLDLLMI